MTQPTPRADCAETRYIVLRILHLLKPETITAEMVEEAEREYIKRKEQRHELPHL